MKSIGKYWVRYHRDDYAAIWGHAVVRVSQYVLVNPTVDKLEIPSDFYHCVRCKLIATEIVMREYSCS